MSNKKFSKETIKKIKDLLYNLYDKLDPSLTNTKFIREKLDAMTDTEFEKYFRNFISNEQEQLKLHIQPHFNKLTLENIEKAANFLKVPLYEKVAMPFINKNGETYYTIHEVPVGYTHIKRLSQTISKKNSMSIRIEKRSALTGQVVDKDKNGRMSDMDNIALVTLDNDVLLKEFVAAKSDDMFLKGEMLKQIKNQGYVDLSDVQSGPGNKVALNTLDVYFTSMGIKTNLITDGLLLKRTMETNGKDVNSITKKHKLNNY